MRIARRTAVPTLALVLAPLAAAAQVDTAAVDRIFAAVDSTTTPGCVVGVSRGDQTVLLRAYGMANLETGTPNTPATIFEAGSVSKQFTSAAVVMLAQAGRLSLDDDVRRHLPSLPDYGTPVTLRRMLTHTSGLRDWGSVVAVGGWPRGSREYRQEHVLDVVSRQRGLNYTPGAEYLYSNSNYTILTGIVDSVSGVPFAEYTRTTFFAPLGMAHTSWRDDHHRVVPGRATAYARIPGGWRTEMPFENTYGHGALLTTVPDLLRWSRNFDTRAVGGDAFVREMTTRGVLTSGRVNNYALGVDVGPRLGRPALSHSGATAGYRAFLVNYPAEETSVAVLCNAGSVNPVDAGDRVAALFLRPLAPVGAAAPAAPSDETVPQPDSVLAARAGIYRSEATGEAYPVRAVPGGLSLANGRLVPVSPTRFRMENSVIRAWFDVDAEGRTSALHVAVANGDTLHLLPAEAWAPTAEEEAALLGAYTSDEADVSYTVVARPGGGVDLWRRPDDRMMLMPLYRDAFQAVNTPWIVRVHRDAGGRVVALGFTDSRMRDLRFRRVD